MSPTCWVFYFWKYIYLKVFGEKNSRFQKKNQISDESFQISVSWFFFNNIHRTTFWHIQIFVHNFPVSPMITLTISHIPKKNWPAVYENVRFLCDCITIEMRHKYNEKYVTGKLWYMSISKDQKKIYIWYLCWL